MWPAPIPQETLRKRGGPLDKSFNFLGLSFLICQYSYSCIAACLSWGGGEGDMTTLGSEIVCEELVGREVNVVGN